MTAFSSTSLFLFCRFSFSGCLQRNSLSMTTESCGHTVSVDFMHFPGSCWSGRGLFDAFCLLIINRVPKREFHEACQPIKGCFTLGAAIPLYMHPQFLKGSHRDAGRLEMSLSQIPINVIRYLLHSGIRVAGLKQAIISQGSILALFNYTEEENYSNFAFLTELPCCHAQTCFF